MTHPALISNLRRVFACINWECIPSRDGTAVCVRPMHFDEDGVRVVRYAPDPCEFIPIARAQRMARRLEKSPGVWRTLCASSGAGWED